MSELIGLDEAKLHCRIDNDDSYEDAMIQAYIEASLEVCQKHIGKRFGAGSNLLLPSRSDALCTFPNCTNTAR